MLVFVDESGRDTYPTGKCRRKDKLFVELAVVFDSEDIIESTYDDVLNISIPGSDVTIRDLIDLQKRLGGISELRAGYILNLEGPFSSLRTLPKDRVKRVKEELINAITKVVITASRNVVAVIIDKDDLRKLSAKLNRSIDIRLFTIEALLTRVAMLCERYNEGAIVTHDSISGREEDVKDLLRELKTRGYFYNPRLRYRPSYSLIERIEFRDSKTCKAIQLADILANTVLRYRAGTGGTEAYRILASSTKYIEFMYRRSS